MNVLENDAVVCCNPKLIESRYFMGFNTSFFASRPSSCAMSMAHT